jgi:hypothetical protein
MNFKRFACFVDVIEFVCATINKICDKIIYGREFDGWNNSTIAQLTNNESNHFIYQEHIVYEIINIKEYRCILH